MSSKIQKDPQSFGKCVVKIGSTIVAVEVKDIHNHVRSVKPEDYVSRGITPPMEFLPTCPSSC
jgi:hypothetical protein